MESPKLPIGLSARAAGMILLIGGPVILVHLCDYITQYSVQSGQCWMRDTDFMEMFSGQGLLTANFRKRGYAAQWYDIDGRPDRNNFMSLQGFIVAVRDVMRVKPGGYMHGGHPCNGFVWMSTGTHYRHLSILGALDSALAESSNLICARFSLILILCISLRVFWTVEQPATSKLIYFPYIQHIINALADDGGDAHGNIFYQRFWMGLYGSLTPKASYLFGSVPWIKDLAGTMTDEEKKSLKPSKDSGMVKKTVDPSGAVKVSGGPSLKASAAYPDKWCQWIVERQSSLWDRGGMPDPDLPSTPEEIRELMPKVPPFDWKHANLDEIRTFLVAEACAGRFTPASGLPL